MSQDKRVTGGAGAVPPPDAPQETAQPLSPETLVAHQAAARANEKTLAPFAPRAVHGAPVAPVAPTPDLAANLKEFFGEPTLTAPAPDRPVSPSVPFEPQPVPLNDPDLSSVEQMQDLPPLTDEDRQRMPAASAGESPAKGILPGLVPDTSDPKWDGISKGGFSDVGEAQYFPLTGDELRELVMALCDDLVGRIQNDLRFSMALTYPRVRAMLRLIVEGNPEDDNAGFTIEKVHIPKGGEPGSTVEEVALSRADHCLFVVQTLRQEFTPHGEVDAPPDQIRAELRLPIPRKQMTTSGGRPVFVDIVTDGGGDTAALTR